MAIREDEIAAGAMGVNPVRFKLLAFAIGAAFAGMTGVFFVAKLQTATPEMFNFPVSTMLLVMVVLGGMGSVWGVVLGAVLLQLMQTWFLPQLTGWIHALGDAIGSALLQHVDLVQCTELIFGIILVVMMLFRREGLIPATRKAAALTFEAQHAEVARGGFLNLDRMPKLGRPAAATRSRSATSPSDSAAWSRSTRSTSTVPAGGVVAVIGPNGSGKSTLFNVITGLVPADAGTITFHRRRTARPAAARVLDAGVARTFQNIRLFPNLSVLENVLVGQHARLHSGAVASVLHTPGTWPRSRAPARPRSTSSPCSATA